MMARNAFLYVAVIVFGIILVTLPSFAAAKKKAADKPDLAVVRPNVGHLSTSHKNAENHSGQDEIVRVPIDFADMD